MSKGYVTVFFSITMALMLSLIIVMLYATRENALRMKSKEAVNIAAKSVFAEYDRELFERYGLLLVDPGYGYGMQSLLLCEEHFVRCVNRNFDEENFKILGGKDLLKLACIGADTTGIRFATDNCGAVLRRQAVKYMEDRFKIGYVSNLVEIVTNFDSYSFDENTLQTDVDNSISDIGIQGQKPELADWINEASQMITSEGEVGFLSTLRIVCPDINAISTSEIDESHLVSGRDINIGNIPDSDTSTAENLLFLREYFAVKCANYVDAIEGTGLSYETEYLIAGHERDCDNLEACVNRILLIREIANYRTISGDEKKASSIETIANIISALLLSPELSEPIQILIKAVWSYLESVSDVKALLGGAKIALVKEPSEWSTSLDTLFSHKDTSGESENGLSYRDYLRIFMYTVNAEKLTKRFMNVVELNQRITTGNSNFRLDMCFDAIEFKAQIVSAYGYDYEVIGKYYFE